MSRMHELQIYSARKEAMWGRVYRFEGFLRHQVTVLQGSDPRIYDNFWSEYDEFRLWEAICSDFGVLHVSFTRVLPTNLRQLLLENRLFGVISGVFRSFWGIRWQFYKGMTHDFGERFIRITSIFTLQRETCCV